MIRKRLSFYKNMTYVIVCEKKHMYIEFVVEIFLTLVERKGKCLAKVDAIF